MERQMLHPIYRDLGAINNGAILDLAEIRKFSKAFFNNLYLHFKVS